MTDLVYWVRRAVELFLAPFDLLPDPWGLIAVSVVTGVIMVVVVGKVTPQERIRRCRSRMAAAVYEIRLFLDSPRRVFTAQGQLLWASLGYTVFLLPALVVLTVPLGILYLHLDARHGLEPLEPGRAVVVTVTLDDDFDGYAVEPGALPDQVEITAPPVVDRERGEVHLRLEVDAPGTFELPIRAGDRTVAKTIAAGDSAVVPERVRGAGLLWSIGLEPPLPGDTPVRSIRVDHPSAQRAWLGLPMPWWLFWLLVATVGALVARKPLRVEL